MNLRNLSNTKIVLLLWALFIVFIWDGHEDSANGEVTIGMDSVELFALLGRSGKADGLSAQPR
jgi:hypothetical protein